MLIDWFTVGAQVVNFLILVLLLKHFLYKPILSAIDAREKRIADELAAAEAQKAEAQKERVDFQEKTEAFDDQRTALLSKAAEEAKVESQRLLGDAHKDADAFRAAQAEALRKDGKRLSGEITRLARNEVFEIARKALKDLATVSLEERIGEVFTRNLREMDPKAKEILGVALRTSAEPAVVRSTFDLGDKQKAAIQNALNESFSSEVHVRFDIAPDGVCGIELTANGQKLGWNIAGYIAELDEKVGALLDNPAAEASTPRSDATAATTALKPAA
jgi:F-type H+-transporting ATPase subunit b